jgi:5-methylcytosine-specific restriction endonuclease McrA
MSGWPVEVKGDYPAAWPEIATAVKDAAGWRCIRCGHPDPPDFKPRGEHPCDERCDHSARWKRRFGKSHTLTLPERKGDHWYWHKQPARRVLTVHHLDGDKAHCSWWNLLALCQVCHLQVQAKVDPRRPYLWEHQAWFKPYAAGFYAFWYGRMADITRAEAEAEMDRWLALGQPWLYEYKP